MYKERTLNTVDYLSLQLASVNFTQFRPEPSENVVIGSDYILFASEGRGLRGAIFFFSFDEIPSQLDGCLDNL